MKSTNKGRKKVKKAMPRKKEKKENLKHPPDFSGKVEKEEMVSLFDPIINAYREFPLSVVLKFIQSAKEAEEKLSGKKK